MSNTNYITGKIAAILNKYSVVINRGYNDGVSTDDEFYIFTEIGPFFDPDTGEDLGTTKKIWGKVRVVTLEKRFCIAETDYAMSANLNLPDIFRNMRVQLPVDESEIIREANKITIGTKVILGVHPKQISSTKQGALPEPLSEDNSDTGSEK